MSKIIAELNSVRIAEEIFGELVLSVDFNITSDGKKNPGWGWEKIFKKGMNTKEVSNAFRHIADKIDKSFEAQTKESL